jgi:PIN domain nuclease of toxin-antitoxin system
MKIVQKIAIAFTLLLIAGPVLAKNLKGAVKSGNVAAVKEELKDKNLTARDIDEAMTASFSHRRDIQLGHQYTNKKALYEQQDKIDRMLNERKAK